MICTKDYEECSSSPSNWDKCRTKGSQVYFSHLRVKGFAQVTADLCSESAAMNWEKKVESEKLLIKKRFAVITKKYPALRDCIKDLKDNASVVHPQCKNFDALAEYFAVVTQTDLTQDDMQSERDS